MSDKKPLISTDVYVVVGTAFGHKNQCLSAPMDKAHAEALVDSIKKSMTDIDKEFKVFDNVKIQKYTPDEYEPVKKDDKSTYGYSILDTLDKKINDKK